MLLLLAMNVAAWVAAFRLAPGSVMERITCANLAAVGASALFAFGSFVHHMIWLWRFRRGNEE